MWRVIACAASLALSSEAAAKDLGRRGEVFPVIETDLFAEIAGRFARLEAAGEVDRINRRLAERAMASAERPPAVPGIARTAEPRRWTYDPTITLARDIVTPDGTVLGRAGDSFNPLDHTPLHQSLVFFDGDDPEQIAWVKAEMNSRQTIVSPILVAGPVADLSRAWERQVFFDQSGKLTGRFGITQVPARITRDGSTLLVEEVLP
ncbi:MAG: type-F conjugative transfer system protein TraW [Pseudomonadota bacterium]